MMKIKMKSFFALISLMTALPACAEWSPLFEVDTYFVYMDKSTLSRSGAIAKVWVLYDYKEKREGIASMKDLDQIDCKNVESRVIARVAYAESMGKGSIVLSILDKSKTPPPFSPIVPGSVADGFFKAVCVK